MKGIRNEKRIALLFVIVALLAVWFFWSALREDKKVEQLNLFHLVASEPTGLMVINRPSIFNNIILTDSISRKIFASFIPELYLSVIEKNKEIPFLLLSFHASGIVLYAKADAEQVLTIEKNIPLLLKDNALIPQEQKVKGIRYTYYPLPENQFWGNFLHEGIWVASYSKKLLEEVAGRFQTTEVSSSSVDSIIHMFDPTAPVNIVFPVDSLNLCLQQGDSVIWKPEGKWQIADLFVNKENICCFATLPKLPADSLYKVLSDSLTLYIQTRFPSLQFSHELTPNNGNMYYIGCNREE